MLSKITIFYFKNQLFKDKSLKKKLDVIYKPIIKLLVIERHVLKGIP